MVRGVLPMRVRYDMKGAMVSRRGTTRRKRAKREALSTRIWSTTDEHMKYC